MEFLSTFEGTRRGRRRRSWRRAAWLLGVAVTVGLTGGVGYRLGSSQGRTEAERLGRDLAGMRELSREMSERVARAEQQAEAAIARAARLQRRLETELPQGELKDLVARLAERLRAGVPASRLAFLLDAAAVDRRCAPTLETQRLAVYTPLATSPIAAAAFAGGRVMVSAEGATAPATDAQAADGQPGFDPQRPVTLRFLAIDGDVGTVRGRLPLTHALAQADEELRFAVRASDQPGLIEITSQRCPLP